MVHGVFVRTTNIHTRAAANRLKPFEYFNIIGGIGFGFNGFGLWGIKQIAAHTLILYFFIMGFEVK
jgi:hypothetical protein